MRIQTEAWLIAQRNGITHGNLWQRERDREAMRSLVEGTVKGDTPRCELCGDELLGPIEAGWGACSDCRFGDA